MIEPIVRPNLMQELSRLEDFIVTHRGSVETASPELAEDWNTLCDQIALVNGLIAFSAKQ